MLTDFTNNCVVGYLLPSGEYLITPETKADQGKGATPFSPLTDGSLLSFQNTPSLAVKCPTRVVQCCACCARVLPPNAKPAAG
jgi:hypothetical protein